MKTKVVRGAEVAARYSTDGAEVEFVVPRDGQLRLGSRVQLVMPRSGWLGRLPTWISRWLPGRWRPWSMGVFICTDLAFRGDQMHVRAVDVSTFLLQMRGLA